MTDSEICRSYRNAINQGAQIRILAELTGKERLDIIMVLAAGGEKLPKKCIKSLLKRLDVLDEQIGEREAEYKKIVKVISKSGEEEG